MATVSVEPIDEFEAGGRQRRRAQSPFRATAGPRITRDGKTMTAATVAMKLPLPDQFGPISTAGSRDPVQPEVSIARPKRDRRRLHTDTLHRAFGAATASSHDRLTAMTAMRHRQAERPPTLGAIG